MYTNAARNRYSFRRSYRNTRATNRPYTRFSRVPRPFYPSLVEVKEVQTAQASTVVPVGGSVECINLTAGGTGIQGNRIGRRICQKAIEIQYASAGPSTSGATDYVKMSIIWVKATIGTTIANYATFYNILTTPYQSLLNTANRRDQIKTIWEDIIFVGRNAGAPGGLENSSAHKYVRIPLPQQLCCYGEATIAIPNQGALYFCICSLNNTGLATTSASIEFLTKITYTDM